MLSVHNPDDPSRFLRGELNAGENRRIVRHLLVARRGSRQPVPDARTFAEADYGQAFSGLGSRLSDHTREMARERQALPLLIERQRDLPPSARRDLLGSDPSFHNWPFGEWLIEESQNLADSDPGRAGELAGEAVLIMEALVSGTYGAALIADFQARAWAARGEALRRLSDLRGAEAAFTSAEECLFDGTEDPLEEAQILELKAALYRDQRRVEEAHRLLDDVIAVYRQYRDPHLLGRAFIQKGRVEGKVNALEPAIRWLRKGLGLIDPARERSLDLSARHSLMLYLNESGRPREARFLLKASGPEFLRHGSPLLNLRLRWLEGKIYDALGFLGEAEKALIDARQGFADLGVGFSAAAVSLDLAGLYAVHGRAAELRSLAEEMLPIFQSRDLQQETIAALLAFQQAARMEATIETKINAEIQACLDRARQDPKLRFEPL
jgi:tetratricopeptide (TPR) repeat protein